MWAETGNFRRMLSSLLFQLLQKKRRRLLDLQVHSMVANMWYSGASAAGKHPALLGGLVRVFKGHRLSPTLAMLVFFCSLN